MTDRRGSLLDAALDSFEGIRMGELLRASLSLTDLLIRLIDEHMELEVVTPREHSQGQPSLVSPPSRLGSAPS